MGEVTARCWTTEDSKRTHQVSHEHDQRNSRILVAAGKRGRLRFKCSRGAGKAPHRTPRLTSKTLHLALRSLSKEKKMLGVERNAVPPDPNSATSAVCGKGRR